MSSSYKRPREPSPVSDNKRRRSGERDRDRRDDRHRSSGRSHRDSDRGRYGHRDEHRSRRDDDRRDSRRDRSRDRDRGRDRGRDKDRGRDSERDRDRHRDRDRDRDREGGRDSKQDVGKISSLDKEKTVPTESEKEEGEISPRPSSPSPMRTVSPRPSSAGPTNGRSSAKNGASSQPQPEPEEDLEIALRPPSPDLQKIIAERRAKRQSILAKYASQGLSQNLTPTETPASIQQREGRGGGKEKTLNGSGAALRPLGDSDIGADHARQAEPIEDTDGQDGPAEAAKNAGDDFSLIKDEDVEMFPAEVPTTSTIMPTTSQVVPEEQVSAADYDPSDDRREDEMRRARVPIPVPAIPFVQPQQDWDDDDMFAVGKRSVPKDITTQLAVAPATNLPLPAIADSGTDEEGYYRTILGELLDNGKYQVFESLGKGMFSGVVRARVLDPALGEGREVAIKVIRSQDTMYKAGLKEVQILNKLLQADPEDKRHVIRLERTFEHRGHLCLVFESLSMNLRDVIKRFGKDVGLNIKAVRAYAQQMFVALGLFRKCNILHADLKPDNILVNDQKTVLKICDLGSASDVAENDITPYLVSRFYRAPEIILGLPYDPAIDIWSIGCTLYELYTGTILFPGRTNNHMLLLMMELKGRFNNKLIKKARFGDVHFDEQGAFISVEKDRVTGGDVIRKIHISKVNRDLKARLMPNPYALAGRSQAAREEEIKVMSSFVDLLDKCLSLDPARRITPKDALAHPFFRL